MTEWDEVAKYYDLIFGDRKVDIAFWQKMSKMFGSQILELCCGTGRLTFPIAETGVKVVGMDKSEPMLKEARKNLKSQSSKVRSRVSFVQGDALSFSYKSKFKAIFSPWWFGPKDKTEQKSMLTCVKKHLEKDGYFVVDTYNFRERSEDWATSYIAFCKDMPNLGFTLVRQCFDKGSAKDKTSEIVHFLDRVYRNGIVKRIVTERIDRHYSKSELESVLWENGFKVVKVYGDYDFGSWTKLSERVIIVAQPATFPYFLKLRLLLRQFLVNYAGKI